MSKLEQLIKEKCPNGVEYKRLEDVCNISKGVQFNKKDMNDIGSYPVINGGINPSGYIEQFNENENTITISQGGASAGYVNCIETKFWCGAHCYTVKPTNVVLNRYAYHFIKSQEKKLQECQYGAGIPALSKKTIAELSFPVPPLEVQREIVEILDNFTLLSAELSAELSARKEQFQNYLDRLFESASDNLVKISSLGTLQRGKRFVHADAVDDGVPCIHYGELYTYYGVYANKAKSHIREELRPKMRYATKTDVIIVGAGENNEDIGVGVVWDGDEDVAVHDACYTLKHNQNPKYISYFLRSSSYHKQIKKYVSEGKICAISADGIGNALIPLPSLDKQNKIVKTLDSFYSLTNSINEGLPAEIEARQKQYEYYRDKLLTFKRLEA